MLDVLILTSGPVSVRPMRTGLLGEGMAVRAQPFGSAALALLDHHAPDVVLILHAEGSPAAMAHEVHALTVIRQVRAHATAPILVVADLPNEDDRLLVFTGGADDFMPRSVSSRELAARIRVHAKRRMGQTLRVPSPMESGPLRLDRARHQATLRGDPLTLTPIEFRLLAVLAAHPEVVIPHHDLLLAVWGPRHDTDTPYLRVYVRSLRLKIEIDPSHPRHLLTEARVGYVWRP